MGDEPVYQVGEYWLEKRRDGRSPCWQITWYEPGTRNVRYRSTRCAGVEEAKRALDAFFVEQQQPQTQKPEEVSVAVLFLEYLNQHGPDIIGIGQSDSSLRQFYAFMKQDRIGVAAKVSDLGEAAIKRFIRWRMAPHSYEITWRGKEYSHRSKGVKGESVQRNIDDIRAAVGFAYKAGRITSMPHIPSVPSKDRSPPRDRVLTIEEMASILDYAKGTHLLPFVLGIMGTLTRPEAVLAWDIPKQFNAATGVLDTHPPSKPFTNKVNPIIPAPQFLQPWLRACKGYWVSRKGEPVKSIKTAWRTMRKDLGFGQEVVAKTIRHTMITYLYTTEVPEAQIETMAGHRGRTGSSKATTGRYAHLRPGYCRQAADAIDAYAEKLSRLTTSHLAVH